MINTILGSKGKMSQTFIEGFRIPVTKVVAGPCIVTQVKRQEKDGYWAVQLGFGERRIKNVTKPMQGHLKGAIKENKAPRFLAEVRLESEPEYKVGDTINASDIFKVGDVITVSGISKGKGFAGVVKRWGFAGGPRTHGQSDRERAPGSIGSTTTPGRVVKGKKMAGRMGSDKVTISGLHVLSVNPETNELEISGPVPGVSGGNIVITKVSSGSLAELEKETVAQIVEGEAPAEAGGESTTETQQPTTESGGTPNA